jgi:hypothetical protein
MGVVLEIVYKKVSDLIPYVNNARTHSEEQVNQIVSSVTIGNIKGNYG